MTTMAMALTLQDRSSAMGVTPLWDGIIPEWLPGPSYSCSQLAGNQLTVPSLLHLTEMDSRRHIMPVRGSIPILGEPLRTAPRRGILTLAYGAYNSTVPPLSRWIQQHISIRTSLFFSRWAMTVGTALDHPSPLMSLTRMETELTSSRRTPIVLQGRTAR